MQRVYLVPAPDMDPRANDAIVLDGVEIIQLRLPKLSMDIKLESVIEQLTAQIHDDEPTLLGFCYGSVLAIEVAKSTSVKKIVVVSGIKSSRELGFFRKTILYAFPYMPEFIMKAIGVSLVFVVNRVLRLNVKIPRLWLKASQNKFIVTHLVKFDCCAVESKVVRVHGDKDSLVPMSGQKIDFVIRSGGHFMFISHRRQVLDAITHAIQGHFPRVDHQFL